MNCPTCGRREPPTTRRFCDDCGGRLADRVPDLRPRASRRSAVLRRLRAGRSSGRAGSFDPPSRAPRDYTPKHLADKILQSKSALEGERKQVTVLFADVKGSLELAEQVDPEEWHRILDRFFQILADGVHRFEGTVNQYTGDGIMALFGAPIAHEDHAQRACYAALRLQRRAAALRRRAAARGVSTSRCAWASTPARSWSGRSATTCAWTTRPRDTRSGLAARMEQIAASDRIYLTEQTARLVEGFFELRDLGQLDVKGVREPLRVYELQGVGPLRTRLEVAASRGLVRFVGRQGEMEQLRRAWEAARAGHGQIVGVVGEAGVGKSRLVYEFKVPLGAGMPGARGLLGLPRQGECVSAADRPAEELLRDQARGRRAPAAGEDHREGPDAGPGARGHAAVSVLAAWDRGRRGVARADGPADPAAADARGREARAAARDPRSALRADLRGPPLDRRRDPGLPRPAERECGDGEAAAAGRLPARVPARLGRARATTHSSGSILWARRRPGSC